MSWVVKVEKSVGGEVGVRIVEVIDREKGPEGRGLGELEIVRVLLLLVKEHWVMN